MVYFQKNNTKCKVHKSHTSCTENTKVTQKQRTQNSINVRTAILAYSTICAQNTDII